MKYLAQICAFLMTCFVVMCAWAQQQPPQTIEESYSFIGSLITAIIEGKWLVVGGIVLMVAMVVVREKILPKNPKLSEYMPLITIATGIVAKVGLDLSQGLAVADDWWKGGLVALVTMGGWDFIGKKLLSLLGVEVTPLKDIKALDNK